ncbi:MAG: hypothetical protein MI748_00950 [Opitutales bacterium]|nr:hypothetical protein [Opitutales bacterium]
MNQAFDDYYSAKIGSSWGELKASLLKPSVKVARMTSVGSKLQMDLGSSSEVLDGCYDPYTAEVQELIDEHPGMFYLMDPASVLAVRQLDLGGRLRIWDMCAAPGGKTLLMLENKEPETYVLATDMSRPRVERLKQVIHQYFAPLSEHPEVSVRSADAVNWGYRNQEKYDAILLDAPCSSERHVMGDPKAMSNWKPNRAKTLPKRQYALLCSAALACERGGQILYSTCSINPDENDSVIARYLKKKTDLVVRPLAPSVGKPTEHGTLVLPHECEGWGPMYFALLEKVEGT